MNKLLLNFCKSLQTQDTAERHKLLREINASDEVVKSIDETVNSLAKANTSLIIEPTESKIKKTEKDNQIIFRSDFIYGFEKDNIFHNIPEDLNSKTEKKAEHIDEEITFTLDPNTKSIISIYESMAAITYGIQTKSSKAISFIILLAIITTIYFILTK